MPSQEFGEVGVVSLAATLRHDPGGNVSVSDRCPVRSVSRQQGDPQGHWEFFSASAAQQAPPVPTVGQVVEGAADLGRQPESLRYQLGDLAQTQLFGGQISHRAGQPPQNLGQRGGARGARIRERADQDPQLLHRTAPDDRDDVRNDGPLVDPVLLDSIGAASHVGQQCQVEGVLSGRPIDSDEVAQPHRRHRRGQSVFPREPHARGPWPGTATLRPQRHAASAAPLAYPIVTPPAPNGQP